MFGVWNIPEAEQQHIEQLLADFATAFGLANTVAGSFCRISEQIYQFRKKQYLCTINYNEMPQQNQSIETAIMPFKVQQLMEIIMDKKQLGYEDAFDYLYSSDCYKLLLQEDTKLWYMSGLEIYKLLEEEKKAKQAKPKVLLFFVFCLEKYKAFAHISAAETLFVFRKYRVFDYLCEGFEVLHTQGEKYIVSDIDEFIKAQQR
ncbi:MAG: DUF3791 domain-containing protein [Prevotellaceae bacterium]|jgi:hypothetical protein|nr:DUF3791 domain-containing protein [Prevotellaceae bacterium]